MTDRVHHNTSGKRRYEIDYVPDPDLYKAVMFARRMISEGTPAGVANTRAANYYEVDVSDVARHVGQAGRASRRRRRRS